MKHLLATIGLLVAVAAAAGLVSFKLGRESDIRDALQKQDALAWLRTDFRLNDAQFTVIRKLHDSYSLVCEEHCRAIQEAATARNTLKAAAQPDAAALAAAERRVQELRLVCETAIAAHVRQVAAEMSPDEGRRYLALVLPKIADFDHRAPPDLGLNRPNH
jgi:CRISPR/Cas system-associated endonuclease Cas1